MTKLILFAFPMTSLLVHICIRNVRYNPKTVKRLPKICYLCISKSYILSHNSPNRIPVLLAQTKTYPSPQLRQMSQIYTNNEARSKYPDRVGRQENRSFACYCVYFFYLYVMSHSTSTMQISCTLLGAQFNQKT